MKISITYFPKQPKPHHETLNHNNATPPFASQKPPASISIKANCGILQKINCDLCRGKPIRGWNTKKTPRKTLPKRESCHARRKTRTTKKWPNFGQSLSPTSNRIKRKKKKKDTEDRKSRKKTLWVNRSCIAFFPRSGGSPAKKVILLNSCFRLPPPSPITMFFEG